MAKTRGKAERQNAGDCSPQTFEIENKKGNRLNKFRLHLGGNIPICERNQILFSLMWDATLIHKLVLHQIMVVSNQIWVF